MLVTKSPVGLHWHRLRIFLVKSLTTSLIIPEYWAESFGFSIRLLSTTLSLYHLSPSLLEQKHVCTEINQSKRKHNKESEL